MNHSRELEQWRGEIEARVVTLEQEMKAMRQFKHDLALQTLQPLQRQLGELHRVVTEPPPYWNDLVQHLKNGKGEDRHLTMRDFKIMFGTLTVAVPIAIWIGKTLFR